MKAEPVLAALIANLATGAAGLLAVYGLKVPPAVVGAVVPLLAVVIAFAARSRVSPVPPVHPVPVVVAGEKLPGM